MVAVAVSNLPILFCHEKCHGQSDPFGHWFWFLVTVTVVLVPLVLDACKAATALGSVEWVHDAGEPTAMVLLPETWPPWGSPGPESGI